MVAGEVCSKLRIRLYTIGSANANSTYAKAGTRNIARPYRARGGGLRTAEARPPGAEPRAPARRVPVAILVNQGHLPGGPDSRRFPRTHPFQKSLPVEGSLSPSMRFTVVMRMCPELRPYRSDLCASSAGRRELRRCPERTLLGRGRRTPA